MKNNNKNKFSKILLISILIVISIFTSCNITCIQGKGNIVKNERKTPAFNAIDISGAVNVILFQDSLTSVYVEADENLQQYIIAKVENNKLIIETKKSLCATKEINVYISSPSIENIDLSGAVDVKSMNKLTPSTLELNLSGACELKLDLLVQNLDIDCSGAVKLMLTGTAVNTKLDGSGASEVEAYDLLTENFSISSSGAGEAKVNVSKKLDVDISGAGTVLYKGSPVVNQEISGAGSIKKAE